MMCPARLKSMVAVAAILILAIGGVVAQERQQSAPEEARSEAKATSRPAAGTGVAAMPDVPANRAIARKQLALIDETWDILLTMAPNARIELGSGIFGQWGRRRLEALRTAGAGKAEIVAGLEKYIKDLEQLEAIAIARKEAARATQLGIQEMQFLRMEAEIWLNEEKDR
ncbi:hypothetical protein P12x_005848 [Tundrisphaera lichenicola]|uniref:hypothetical protein n=1 Tax=Tundrisphaera lichenicola TaxID=2029860 RepID=UPI003EB8F4B4